MARPAAAPLIRPAAATWALLGFLLASPAGSAHLPSAGEGASSPSQCILTGTWTNELGSTMKISVVNMVNGEFSGTYMTAVKDATKPITESPLLGSQQLPIMNQPFQPTFGFTVHWTFAESITAFVGQCFMGQNRVETLETMWLLRKQAGSSADNWKQTLVGRNVFTRVK